MAGEWFCKIAGAKHGPYTPQQLKALAAGGKLHPEDLVRHGAEGQWVAAQRVKGLFADAPAAKAAEAAPGKPGAKKAKGVSAPGGRPFVPKKPLKNVSRMQLVLAGGIGVAVLVVALAAGLWHWYRSSKATPTSEVAAAESAAAAPQKPEQAEAAKPKSEPEAKPAAEPAKAEQIIWHKPDETVTFTDEEVTVKLQSVSLVNLGAYRFPTDKKGLLVAMKVENTSATKKIDLQAWGKVSPSYPWISLTDDLNNKYTLYRVNGPMPSIYPKQAHVDELFFERPIDSAQALKLVLPASAFGGKGGLNFEIPRAMITVEAQPKLAKGEKPAGAAKPGGTAKPVDDFANPGMIDLDQKIQVKTGSKPGGKPFEQTKSAPKLTELFGMPEAKDKQSETPTKKGTKRTRP